MIMHWPQITMVMLWALNLGLTAAYDGKPKTGKHNLIATLISCGISFWLLYEGGFFAGLCQ